MKSGKAAPISDPLWIKWLRRRVFNNHGCKKIHLGGEEKSIQILFDPALPRIQLRRIVTWLNQGQVGEKTLANLAPKQDLSQIEALAFSHRFRKASNKNGGRILGLPLDIVLKAVKAFETQTQAPLVDSAATIAVGGRPLYVAQPGTVFDPRMAISMIGRDLLDCVVENAVPLDLAKIHSPQPEIFAQEVVGKIDQAKAEAYELELAIIRQLFVRNDLETAQDARRFVLVFQDRSAAAQDVPDIGSALKSAIVSTDSRYPLILEREIKTKIRRCYFKLYKQLKPLVAQNEQGLKRAALLAMGIHSRPFSRSFEITLAEAKDFLKGSPKENIETFLAETERYLTAEESRLFSLSEMVALLINS